MTMIMTGELKIHKADGVTRTADAVVENTTGSLMVWDDIASGFIKVDYPGGSASPVIVDKRDSDLIEPDIIVKPDKWERVEREKHSWKQSSAKALVERAERRDDVDEEEVKKGLK